MSTKVETAARDAFRVVFGGEPDFIGVGNARVNIIGEHTDYNGGFVLPVQLPFITVVVGSKCANDAGDQSMQIYSCEEVFGNKTITKTPYPLESPVTQNTWMNYILGVVCTFEKELGNNGPYKLVVNTNVPIGAGLSSSAALEVSTLRFMAAANKFDLESKDWSYAAKLCQGVEHSWCNVPCGIMDQAIAVLGKPGEAVLLNCTTFNAKTIPTPPNTKFVIIDSGVKHQLAGGEYAKRAAQCKSAATKLGVSSLYEATPALLHEKKSVLDDIEYRRAKHVIFEDVRTLIVVDNFKKICSENFDDGERTDILKAVGVLMGQSHTSLAEDYEVSCPELDHIVSTVGALPSVWGVRMTGGGFGGCCVALIEATNCETTVKSIEDALPGLRVWLC